MKVTFIVESTQYNVPECLEKLERCCEYKSGTFHIVDYGKTTTLICDITKN